MRPMSKPKAAVFGLLNVGAAILALIGLLPVAGGLPSIASPAVPFADAMWFTVSLGGPLLLLAAGLKMLFRTWSVRWYVLGYTFLVIVGGGLRLWFAGFHRLAHGWLIMAICIGAMLLTLRRIWLWGLIGGVWSGMLLGICSYGNIAGYLSAAAPLFPVLLPIDIVGCVSAFTIGLLHVRLRQPEQSA
jgi:hypothetical protein